MALRIGSGLSEHPEQRAAAVEAGTQALAGLDGLSADVVLVFASGANLLAPELVIEGVHEALAPPVLVGCGAGGVVGAGTEVEGRSAVAVWALAFEDGGGPDGSPARAEPFHARLEETTLVGIPDLEGASAVLLLPDPASFPTDAALEALGRVALGVPVLGGVASARGPGGGAALFLGDGTVPEGAVGLVLRGVEVLPCVSQGAAGFGPLLRVTRAEGNLIHELDDRPALDVLREVIDGLGVVERAKLAGGLLVGIALGPAGESAGEILVRGLVGADPERGAVAVGAVVEEGAVVQLHARDALSADRDLRDALALRREALGGAPPAGALVFTCNGRGVDLFGVTGHDADAVRDELGAVPLAGFFAAGEIGPVGGALHLHGFTATLALFPAA